MKILLYFTFRISKTSRSALMWVLTFGLGNSKTLKFIFPIWIQQNDFTCSCLANKILRHKSWTFFRLCHFSSFYHLSPRSNHLYREILTVWYKVPWFTEVKDKILKTKSGKISWQRARYVVNRTRLLKTKLGL